MLAMQYSLTLPRDYDMGIVRHRVATRGGSFDHTEHLGFKAFLIAEAEASGGKENLYAPFYLWNSEQGMLDFLCGNGFSQLTGSFGWPAVRVWVPMYSGVGNAIQKPTHATRQIMRIAPHSDLLSLRQEEQDRHRTVLQSSDVYAQVAALDPHQWELVRFTLWNIPIEESDYDATDTVRYEVLHLSSPDLQ